MFHLTKYKIVPIMKTANYNGGVDGDSINMAKAHRAIFILTFGAITDAAAVLSIYSGATDGAKTSALTFKYALASGNIGSANADVLAAAASASSLTLTAATYQNKMLIIEVESAAMDMANEEEWLTLAIATGGNAGIVHIVALVEPRYFDGATVLT